MICIYRGTRVDLCAYLVSAVRRGPTRSPELAPTIVESALILPGSSLVASKGVRVTFDGGHLTSDAGVLVLAEIERRLGIAERLARCLTDL